MTAGPVPDRGRVTLIRRWDDAALATGRTVPAAAAALLLKWDEPGRVDAGPGPALARALATMLTRFGAVAFRWRGAPPAGARRLGAGAGGWFSRPPAWSVVAATGADGAAALFEQGWAFGDQVALVSADPARAVPLVCADDLRGQTLAPEDVLLVPIVDGAGAVLAAGKAAALAAALTSLTAALDQAGIELVAPPGFAGPAAG